MRTGVATFGYAAADDHTLVTLATGLGGLPELGIEIDPTKGHSGAEVTRAALTLVPRDEVVVAACAPGNARALRAALSAGFEPVASVQLWRPQRGLSHGAVRTCVTQRARSIPTGRCRHP